MADDGSPQPVRRIGSPAMASHRDGISTTNTVWVFGGAHGSVAGAGPAETTSSRRASLRQWAVAGSAPSPGVALRRMRDQTEFLSARAQEFVGDDPGWIALTEGTWTACQLLTA